MGTTSYVNLFCHNLSIALLTAGSVHALSIATATLSSSSIYVAKASCLAVWLGQTTAHAIFVAYLCTMVPLGAFACKRAQASPLAIEPPFFLHTTTCPESRIRHPYTQEKHGVYFRKSGKLCGALLGRNESSSAYPLMTLPVCRPVTRPSFASITDTLREEFANKGWRLYENIYNL